MTKKPKPRALNRKHQWELAVHFLKRSDESANYVRAILFAASSGAIGFVMTQLKDSTGSVLFHSSAIICFVVSIVLVFISWDIQKWKADCRFRWLRDGNYASYRAHSGQVQKNWYLKNYLYDRTAAVAIVAGFLLELAARLCGPVNGH